MPGYRRQQVFGHPERITPFDGRTLHRPSNRIPDSRSCSLSEFEDPEIIFIGIVWIALSLERLSLLILSLRSCGGLEILTQLVPVYFQSRNTHFERGRRIDLDLRQSDRGRCRPLGFGALFDLPLHIAYDIGPDITFLADFHERQRVSRGRDERNRHRVVFECRSGQCIQQHRPNHGNRGFGERVDVGLPSFPQCILCFRDDGICSRHVGIKGHEGKRSSLCWCFLEDIGQVVRSLLQMRKLGVISAHVDQVFAQEPQQYVIVHGSTPVGNHTAFGSCEAQPAKLTYRIMQ